MKKIISLLVVLALAISVFCMTASAEETAGDYYLAICQADNNKFFVNGVNAEFDETNPEVKPIRDEDGNLLVPLRMVVGAVGGWIDWEEATDSVHILYNGVEISFVMNTNQVKVGDETVEISVAPYTVYDRTLVPLDFFTECMKGSADVDEDTNTIMMAFITKIYAAG